MRYTLTTQGTACVWRKILPEFRVDTPHGPVIVAAPKDADITSVLSFVRDVLQKTKEVASGVLSGEYADKYIGQPLNKALGITSEQQAKAQTLMDLPAVQMGMSLMPMGVGMIKSTGKLPKNSIFPKGMESEVVTPRINSLPKSPRYDVAGNVYEDMGLNISALKNGEFLATYQPQWLRGGAGKYAIGDNIDELINHGLGTIKRTDAGVQAAKTSAFNKSLLGKLDSLGFNADDFKQASSTQSSSNYLTHVPTGTKIRIADHDLPLHYEQPDVDLRSWEPIADQIAKIKASLK